MFAAEPKGAERKGEIVACICFDSPPEFTGATREEGSGPLRTRAVVFRDFTSGSVPDQKPTLHRLAKGKMDFCSFAAEPFCVSHYCWAASKRSLCQYGTSSFLM
jgi:hypothetical protein